MGGFGCLTPSQNRTLALESRSKTSTSMHGFKLVPEPKLGGDSFFSTLTLEASRRTTKLMCRMGSHWANMIPHFAMVSYISKSMSGASERKSPDKDCARALTQSIVEINLVNLSFDLRLRPC